MFMGNTVRTPSVRRRLGHFVPLSVFYLSLIGLNVMSTGETTVLAGDFVVESSRDIGYAKRKVRAAQFLHRATFGPTIEQIEELALRMSEVGVRRACEEWIDEQYELPASMHQPMILQMIEDDGYQTTDNGVWIQRYRHHAWWHHAITAEDQLRQRVAWALIQILVTSDAGAGFKRCQSWKPFWFGTLAWLQ